jgi:hypothetical protein
VSLLSAPVALITGFTSSMYTSHSSYCQKAYTAVVAPAKSYLQCTHKGRTDGVSSSGCKSVCNPVHAPQA